MLLIHTKSFMAVKYIVLPEGEPLHEASPALLKSCLPLLNFLFASCRQWSTTEQLQHSGIAVRPPKMPEQTDCCSNKVWTVCSLMTRAVDSGETGYTALKHSYFVTWNVLKSVTFWCLELLCVKAASKRMNLFLLAYWKILDYKNEQIFFFFSLRMCLSTKTFSWQRYLKYVSSYFLGVQGSPRRPCLKV